MQIIFQTQLPLYKLDTSIICCSVMVSTSDVSRKQIGETWLGGVMGDERQPLNYERPVHQSGSLCFQKCVYSKLKNSGKSTHIQVFFKNRACKKTLNNWKHQNAGMIFLEIHGPVRETDSSPFRIFQWLLQPSASIS